MKKLYTVIGFVFFFLVAEEGEEVEEVEEDEEDEEEEEELFGGDGGLVSTKRYSPVDKSTTTSPECTRRLSAVANERALVLLRPIFSRLVLSFSSSSFLETFVSSESTLNKVSWYVGMAYKAPFFFKINHKKTYTNAEIRRGAKNVHEPKHRHS